MDKLEIAYAGNGKTAPTCIRFRKAIQNGTLKVEDYSNFMMSLRFLAGAMGVPFTAAHGSIRFSLSRYTTEEEIDVVIEKMPPIIERLREMSPFWKEAMASN